MPSSARAALFGAFGFGLPLGALALRRLGTTHRPGHPYLAGAPLLVAHRGGAALAPENTLLAFERALHWWRADILELDVHPTADGEAVVIHDPTVDRTTDGLGRVAAMPLDEVAGLDAGYRFTADGGESYPFRETGVRIPTLRAVLQAFPDARVNVEIKDGRAQHAVWKAVHDLGAAHRVLIASGRSRKVSRFAGYTGPRSASIEDLYRFLFLHRARATALYRTRVDAFQVPERNRGRQVLSPRFVREAQARNLPVHVWTVNREADMRRLLDWGVDGIMTDYPDVLARVLHEMAGRPFPPGPPREAAGS